MILCLLVVPGLGFAKHLHPEKWYQKKYCPGETEVRLYDNIDGKSYVRCDCLTDTHAIEFDFASKWYKAVTQAIYYSLLSGKQPCVYLIIETPKDVRHWKRLTFLTERLKQYNLNLDIKAVGDGVSYIS